MCQGLLEVGSTPAGNQTFKMETVKYNLENVVLPVHFQVVDLQAAILVPGHARKLRLEDRASKEVLLPAVLLRV